jgi:hypothetical protein
MNDSSLSKPMMRSNRFSVAMLAIAIASGTMSAQSVNAVPAAASRAPTPCANDPERHRFDFWIGEWDVTTPNGAPVGNSVIQSVSGGCALLENWTSLSGGHGKSLNAYNPDIHQWQQYWIGQDGKVSEFRSSEFDGKSLVFTIKDQTKPSSVNRLSFTPRDSATVRQHSEVSSDGGTSWKTQYDFFYHRKAN